LQSYTMERKGMEDQCQPRGIISGHTSMLSPHGTKRCRSWCWLQGDEQTTRRGLSLVDVLVRILVRAKRTRTAKIVGSIANVPDPHILAVTDVPESRTSSVAGGSRKSSVLILHCEYFSVICDCFGRSTGTSSTAVADVCICETGSR